MLFIYWHLTGHAEEMQQESRGKRHSARKGVAGIIAQWSIFKTYPSVISTLHPLQIKQVHNTELHQITSLPQKFATNYSY